MRATVRLRHLAKHRRLDQLVVRVGAHHGLDRRPELQGDERPERAAQGAADDDRDAPT
jgi:hypothetical protein